MRVREGTELESFVQGLPVSCAPTGRVRCERDQDCPGHCLCACSSKECSLIAEGTSMAGDLDGWCFSRRSRIEGLVPVKLPDGGRWLDTGAADVPQ